MSTIKTIRDRLGITQSVLAEGIGCTQANVGHYEKGQTVPPPMAERLIEFARTRGLLISFDHVYGTAELPELAVSEARAAADQQKTSGRTPAAEHAESCADADALRSAIVRAKRANLITESRVKPRSFDGPDKRQSSGKPDRGV